MQLLMVNRQSLTFQILAKRSAFLLFFLLQMSLLNAQSTDSLHQSDTVSIKPLSSDTTTKKPVVRKLVKPVVDSIIVFHTDSIRFSEKRPEDFSNLPLDWMKLLGSQRYFNLSGKPVHVRSELYEPASFEGMFYLMVGLLFYFAIIKLFYSKYLANLLTLFFRASMRQQQLREQVLQSPFPSLLLNVLFIFSGGLYVAFLLRFYHYGPPESLWFHFQYAGIFLAGLYLLKYLIIKVVGWIFNRSRAADFYLFVVFMTNKIIGIFLLPFLMLIMFSGTVLTEISVTLSIIMICVFYIYRFVGSYATLHKEIKISGLYFILYLCAFEIAPLLLIYKVLVTYLEKAY
jgi:Domain of unknown function (DUF4271)